MPLHVASTMYSSSGGQDCCIIQSWPPDDEHIVVETCRGV